MATATLEVKGLFWSPGGRAILSGVSLRAEPRQAVWLSGPSGGGKSSLLRMINRLNRPDRGEVFLEGRPVQEFAPTALRRKAALLDQTPVMFPGTVGHNLRLGFGLRAAQGIAPPEEAELKEHLAAMDLGRVGLGDDAAALSVGQKQRLAIIRLLLAGPPLLLLDEPFAPLDPESRALVSAVLEKYTAGGGCCLVVSHVDPGFTGRRLELRDGRIGEAE